MTSIDTAGLPYEEEEGPSLIKNIPTIAWQRRWLIILPTAIGLAAGAAAAYLIPPMYRSEATLVIETQQLPTDLTTTPLNDVIDARIARVRQRVLSRPNLIQIVRNNDLYPADQASKPLSTIIDKMRKNTQVNAIGGNAQGGGTGTIAFNISFDYPDPLPAQLVVQQFVTNFLDLDTQTSTQNAEGAKTFLTDQAAGLQKQIQDVEGQITTIKAQKGGLLAIADQSVTGDNPAADAARIDGQIAGLLAQNQMLATTPNPNADDPDVKAAESQLRIVRAKFADSHPDVLAAQQQLDAAKAAAAKRPSQGNPVAAQVKANDAQISSLRQAKAMILSQGASTKALAAQAPAVAEQVNQLQQRATSLREQFAVVSSKLQGADLQYKVVSENKGERFSVSDPPTVPDEPYWPNRKLLIAGGLFGGIALGLALALLIELMFRPVRGTDALRAVTGRPPLVVIPLLDRKPGLLVRMFERLSRRRLAKRPATAA